MDYRTIHDNITKAYYQEKTLTKEEFDRLHLACNLSSEKEAIVDGKVDNVMANPGELTKTRLDTIDEKLTELKVTPEELEAWK